MIFALLGRVRLKVLYFLFSFLISILPLKAEEIHQSPMVFEECSNKTNILISFQLSLEKYKLDVEKYNDEYKTHIFELDHLEQRVKKLEKEVIANPSNAEFWDNYDAIYKTYKGAVIKINQFEEYGDQLQLDSNQLMSKFVNLRDEISENCDGKWQIGIIRKYCKNGNDQFLQFCKQFDK